MNIIRFDVHKRFDIVTYNVFPSKIRQLVCKDINIAVQLLLYSYRANVLEANSSMNYGDEDKDKMRQQKWNLSLPQSDKNSHRICVNPSGTRVCYILR